MSRNTTDVMLTFYILFKKVKGSQERKKTYIQLYDIYNLILCVASTTKLQKNKW